MADRLSDMQRIALTWLRDDFVAPPPWLRGNTLLALKRLGLVERKVVDDRVLWRRNELGAEEIARLATKHGVTMERRHGR